MGTDWQEEDDLRHPLSFLVISVPFIVALSCSQDRFTFGESAKVPSSVDGEWCKAVLSPLARRSTRAHRRPASTRRSSVGQKCRVLLNLLSELIRLVPPELLECGDRFSLHPLREMKALLVNAYMIEKYFLNVLGFLTTALIMMFF